MGLDARWYRNVRPPQVEEPLVWGEHHVTLNVRYMLIRFRTKCLDAFGLPPRVSLNRVGVAGNCPAYASWKRLLPVPPHLPSIPAPLQTTSRGSVGRSTSPRCITATVVYVGSSSLGIANHHPRWFPFHEVMRREQVCLEG